MTENLIEVKRIGVISSLAAGATENVGNIKVRNCRNLVVSASVTYHASATSGITVKFYVDNEEVGVDTVAYTSFTPTLTAGATVQRSIIIDAPEVRALQVKVKNDDGTYAATKIVVGYSMRKWKAPEIEG